MKKTIIGVFMALIFAMAPSAHAFDLKDALSGLANRGSNADTSDSSSSNGGSLLGGLLSGLLSSDKLTVSDVTGVWQYNGPAVSFKTENFLMKAGGAAAATAVESKLEPYYNAAGMQNMSFTIYPDSTFTMQLNRASLSGTISADVPDGSEANFVFTFKVLGKINMGSMDTYVTKSGNSLSLMFDITKLVAIMQKIASLSGNSTVSGISSILDSYDGICAGFKMTRTGDAPAK